MCICDMQIFGVMIINKKYAYKTSFKIAFVPFKILVLLKGLLFIGK